MRLSFDGEIWYWRGPAPFHFVIVPDEEGEELHTVSVIVSYGWGVIPVTAEIGETNWATSLIPKDGTYLLPVKAAVRDVEGLDVGDRVRVNLTVDLGT
ncbi:MAG TPA: DUF1905 domain-containing protein [Acidimicrobiales bacterium]|nr:DUF1905 domain-containing protein [Acidimicrobiales bacterium]